VARWVETKAEAGLKSWAHTYMAGSLLGTFLIVAALIAFVPLVSLKAPDEWPAPGLGLIGVAAKSDVGVGAAVVAAAKHPEASGLSSNPAGGPSAAAVPVIAAVPASGREPSTGRTGGTEGGGSANGTVAISPAAIEVARTPDSPTSEGAGATVPLPNSPEAGSVPAPAATNGEAGDVGKVGETSSPPPINAGGGIEAPESLPPERPESVPPPPSGGSTEGDGISDCPEEGSEEDAAQVGDSTAPQLP
jgi:hypothetical protein